jgi:hypothetical protein
MNWINKETLVPLLIQHGYSISNAEHDVPDEMFALFVTNIESQMREALRVALVSADNQGRSELQETDMEAVLKQCKMFPGR